MQYHLAPLKNISSWAFRSLAKGATDSYTEMINLKQLLNTNSNKWNLIDTFEIKDQNQWIQVISNKKEEFSRFSNILQEFCEKYPKKSHFKGINLNAGCPDPNIISSGQGAALISKASYMQKIISEFLGDFGEHNFRFSVKMRLGLDMNEMNENKFLDFLEMLKSMDDSRLSPPIIHFKHANQDSFELPRWDLLEVALSANIPIIINGNIEYPQDLNKIKKKLPYKFQNLWSNLIYGIMIGRMAIKNPYCFQKFHPTTKKDKNLDLSDQWEKIFRNNLQIHPPNERFIQKYQELYPQIF